MAVLNKAKFLACRVYGGVFDEIKVIINER